LTILNCCHIDVEHNKTTFVTGTYTVRYRVETDVPYSPNALIDALKLVGDCIEPIGSQYPGLPSGVIAARSAVSQPDGASTLNDIRVSKHVNIDGGKRLRYIVTLQYTPVEAGQPPQPPPGETSPNPLDWCPLYRERHVPRVVEAKAAFFEGMYRSGDLPPLCIVNNCLCVIYIEEGDPGPGVTIKPIKPLDGEVGGSEFEIEIGDCELPINTAGDPITDVITKRVSDIEVNLTRWFALDGAFTPETARCKRDTLNFDEVSLQYDCWGPDPVIVIAPETGLLAMDWTMRTTTDVPGFDIFRYWEVRYQILIRECGWEFDVLNEGLNRLVRPNVTDDGHGGLDGPTPAGNARARTTQIMQRDDKGRVVTRPVPLNEDGQPIFSSDPGDTLNLRWLAQNIEDWSGTGL
jgi:hypothetical protein